jgi:PAS domain S-box-containing protein
MRRINAGMVLALLILIAIGAFSYASIIRVSTASLERAQSRQTILLLEELNSQLKDVEADQRGDPSGTSRSAAARTQLVGAIKNRVAEIEKILRNSPEQAHRLQTLQPQIDELLLGFEEPPGAPPAAAERSTASRAGVALVGRLRPQLEEMARIETLRLEERARTAERMTLQARVLVPALTLFASGLVGVAALFMSRNAARRRSAEQSLRQSEQRFRATIGQAGLGIAQTTLDGQYFLVNPKFCDTLQYTPEELLKMNFREVTHPDFVSGDLAGLKRLLSAEIQYYSTEKQYVRKDGSQIWGNITVSLVRNSDGAPDHFVVTMEDISQRRLIEERFRATIDQAAIGICQVTPEGHFVLANRKLCEIVQYTPEELRSRTFQDLTHPDSLLENLAGLNQLRAGEIPSYTAEKQYLRKDGVAIWANVNVSLVRKANGAADHFVVTVEDISERRRIRDELVRSEERLRDRTRELLASNAAIGEKNKALENSNRDLEDFAYIASHDLKEPLRGIANYASFLLEDYQCKLDEEGERKLKTLPRLAQHMEKLIDSLLYYSRVGKVDLALRPTDLNSVIHSVVDSLQVSLQETKTEVKLSEPLPETFCDQVRVAEVFSNLITNAMKYNDKSHRWIEIGYTREKEKTFYVRDNGIGIRNEHQDSIFRIFKRLHGRDKFGGGTGLGLTVVKKIVERHGGRVWVESTYGQGSTFYFTLQ